MMYIPILLFALAAAGGVIMVSMKMSGKEIPWFLAAGHGLLAAGGLAALVLVSLESAGNVYLNISLLMFVITAAGGFILFNNYVKKRPIPNTLIAIHAFSAIVSYLFLLIVSRSLQ